MDSTHMWWDGDSPQPVLESQHSLWQGSGTKQPPGKAPARAWLLSAAAQASSQPQMLKADLSSHFAC